MDNSTTSTGSASSNSTSRTASGAARLLVLVVLVVQQLALTSTTAITCTNTVLSTHLAPLSPGSSKNCPFFSTKQLLYLSAFRQEKQYHFFE